MSFTTCCTCATLLTDTKLPYTPDSEKPLRQPRTLPCCGRTICASCQHTNPRFTTYCPFCQISTAPSALPSEGLRLPPSYTKTTSTPHTVPDSPPAYSSLSNPPARNTATSSPPTDTRDTIHHLSPTDTLASLSLAYHVPTPVLLSHNRISSSHLLSAHKWILVPHTHYTGPPLSNPPDPEEEERKNKVRRWMVATKCADYEVAQLYLKGSEYDLEIAIESFKDDERWEKEHPLRNGKGKQGRRPAGESLSGQLS